MWVYDSDTNELYHYGRKGMKWGQRIFGKLKSGAGRLKTAANNAKAKRAEKKAVKEQKRRAKITNHKRLTDEELTERINRLRKEKEYMDLIKDTDSGKKGKAFVSDILESVGKNLFTQVGNHYGSKALNKIIGEEVIYANNKKK